MELSWWQITDSNWYSSQFQWFFLTNCWVSLPDPGSRLASVLVAL